MALQATLAQQILDLAETPNFQYLKCSKIVGGGGGSVAGPMGNYSRPLVGKRRGRYKKGGSGIGENGCPWINFVFGSCE